MSLNHSQKNYIRKHIKDQTIPLISSYLEVNENLVLEYLEKRWGKDKLKKFLNKDTYNPKIKRDNPTSLKEFFKKFWSHLLLLSFLVIITYANTLGNGFVSDDIAAIPNNPDLKSFSHVLSDPKVMLRALIHWAAFRIDGTNPFIYHLINLVIHIGATLSVFTLIAFLFDPLLALLTASIFAVHPAISEAVSWISGGGYSQTALFFLLTFLFYILSKESFKKYLISLIFYILTLESIVTAPVLFFILPLYEIAYGNLRKNWKKLIPFLVLSGVWILFALILVPQRINTLQTEYYQSKGFDNPFQQIPIAISSYLFLFAWPQGLTIYHSELSFSPIVFSFYVLTALVFFTLLIWGFKKNKFIFFWFSFFIISLLPTLTPLRISWIVAERYVYLGSLGIFVVFCYYTLKLANKYNLKKPFYILFCILIAALMIRTFIRNIDWKNEDNLWIATGKTSPSDPVTHNNLGDYYTRHGNLTMAASEFLQAISLKKDYADAYHNLANTYEKMGKTDLAISYYQQAIKYNPLLWQSYLNLSVIYFNENKNTLAIAALKKGILKDPKNYSLLFNLAKIYLKNSDKTQARNTLENILQIYPQDQSAKNLLKQT